MNPVDRARKEARKKEIKKNKKQRLQVRSAAIERREPEQIIAELEKLDPQNSFYNDKRKRLKEIFSKILVHYKKEDPTKYDSLKKLEDEFESRHQKKVKELEAIKAAQEVKIDEVFLPPSSDVEQGEDLVNQIADDDPLLADSVFITYDYNMPGCPPGLPPDLGQLMESIANDLPLVADAKPPESLKSNYQNPNRPQKRARYGSANENKSMIRPKPTIPVVEPKKVIAAEPVLYKPSATKFVPSSVRLKSSTDLKKKE